MAKKPSKSPANKEVVTLTHTEASRRNIPTAEYESVMEAEQQAAVRVAYERRNRDLDPQLVWRGKDQQDWSDLVVPAPPLFIQEKVHPKALIDDLLHQAKAARLARQIASGEAAGIGQQIDLFADFNGLPDTDAKTEFYQHDAHWANRMILGDSLQVMASLAEREGLRGKVQCIYIDPPYGIKFNSNFQWSTTNRDVKDGNIDHITREPEQVKAFRDTWKDGINSYLTYLRDRLTTARDLLSQAGALFVQIGDQNVHRVRSILDEVFGEANFVAQISTKTSGGSTGVYLAGVTDFVLWYAKDRESMKYRPRLRRKELGDDGTDKYQRVRLADLRARTLRDDELAARTLPAGARLYRQDNLTSQSVGRDKGEGAASWFGVRINGREIRPSLKVRWKTNERGMSRLLRADRVEITGQSLAYVRFLDDFAAMHEANLWTDIGGVQSRADPKVYVVQTATALIQRCILMSTDPGDLVLDPTCGSGTTAYVAEQWGRRWITIDTSRVALALARARIMGARYYYYLKADSREGQVKEAEVTRSAPSSAPVHNSLRQGFVYERVPHITLKSIANNAEIDVIWEKFQAVMEPVREELNRERLKSEGKRVKGNDGGKASSAIHSSPFTLHSFQDWEIPRDADPNWTPAAKQAHTRWWELRIARQKEIDASIAAKAEFEYLYDKPYEDKKKVRVAGPFTVESLSPHRVMTVGADDELIDPLAAPSRGGGGDDAAGFAQVILETLRVAGVQQAHKEDRITFTSIAPWPGHFIGAEGRYADADGKEKRAGIFIGPEFGTVSRQDLVLAAREAGDAGFDVVIACAFNYEAYASEFNKLGRVPVLKARMNAELHMGAELKNTGKGNLFVIFGEPDIQVLPPEDAPQDADPKDYAMIRVRINGVDVFHPQTGEVRSDGPEGIACWFIDTDYNGESFFVRHAYFLGANDPYKALKTTLKAEINEEAWATLHSDVSRPFPKPESGTVAVKVINHLGDEVMRVFRV
jgi:adenine-specific DNA-methyltransferase